MAKLLGARGIRSAFETIGIIIVLFTLSWPLAVVLLVSALLLTPLITRLSASIGAASKASQAAAANVSAAADEIVENMRVVKLFAQQQRELRRFDTLLNGAHQLALKVGGRAGGDGWQRFKWEEHLWPACCHLTAALCCLPPPLLPAAAGAAPAGAAAWVKPPAQHAVRAGHAGPGCLHGSPLGRLPGHLLQLLCLQVHSPCNLHDLLSTISCPMIRAPIRCPLLPCEQLQLCLFAGQPDQHGWRRGEGGGRHQPRHAGDAAGAGHRHARGGGGGACSPGGSSSIDQQRQRRAAAAGPAAARWLAGRH